MKKITQLIKNECANYDCENHGCIPTDSGCHQYWSDKINCKYFLQSVLPHDMKLYAELMGKDENLRRLLLNGNVTGSTKKCAYCGKLFKTETAGKYCSDECRKIAARNHARIRKQRQRDKCHDNHPPET